MGFFKSHKTKPMAELNEGSLLFAYIAENKLASTISRARGRISKETETRIRKKGTMAILKLNLEFR